MRPRCGCWRTPARRSTRAAMPEIDHLLDGRVALAQPPTGYRVAVDPVLLAAAVDAAPGQRAIDLGCGVGAASFCLMQRVPDLSIVGIDSDAQAVEFAQANARRNGRASFTARQGDILTEADALSALGPFDHVLTNPPFHAAAASDPSPDRARARATVGGFALAGWLAPAARLLGVRGQLTVI